MSYFAFRMVSCRVIVVASLWFFIDANAINRVNRSNFAKTILSEFPGHTNKLEQKVRF